MTYWQDNSPVHLSIDVNCGLEEAPPLQRMDRSTLVELIMLLEWLTARAKAELSQRIGDA